MAMGMLFDCTSDNISVHLQNIYDTDELKKEATTEKISVVRREGNRGVNRTLQFYNLDAIISVGYRVNSIRATQFRQWATSVLREYAIRGYVLDRKRTVNFSILSGVRTPLAASFFVCLNQLSISCSSCLCLEGRL